MPEQILSQSSHTPSLQAQLFGNHRFAARLLPLQRLNELYRKIAEPGRDGFCERLLAEMRIRCTVEQADLDRIPKTGPVMIVANHPFGLLDGLILAANVPRVRPDVKIVTNYLVSEVSELEEICLFVDPFGRSAARNCRPLKEALSWLREQQGVVVVFPAGEVSHWQARRRRIEDPAWNDIAARLVQLSGATVVPAFFTGRNSVAFHALGMIHPTLRTARLAHEFLKARGREVELRIGTPIPDSTITNLPCVQATEYMRWRTYLLANRRMSCASRPRHRFVPAGKPQQKVVDAIPAAALAADIASLPETARLSEDRELEVYAAQAGDLPHVLPELGRLRELTFRQIGEGTGKSIDLDAFDRTYHHLFIWNKVKQEIVGGYRLGRIRELMSSSGVHGLYTNTLFQFDPELFKRLGNALELGRSFVRPEYQRQYAPLLLLWKAIGRFVCNQPENAILFGAVSISGEYQHVSRELLVNFYGSRLSSPLAQYVRPRRAFRTHVLQDWEIRQIAGALDTPETLAEAIADIENDGKEIPILLKQYVKLGGELLGFNVDHDFSNVVDGLVLVDLRRTDRRILERYMGKSGAASFLEFHQNALAPAV